jgi:hypothetical protein
MKNNSILEHPLCPKRLLIDVVGWKAFLEAWDREAFEFLKKETLKYGVHHGGKPGHEKYREQNENYKKKLEANLNCELPRELFFGGVEYPGKTLEDEQLAEDKFREIRAAVEKEVAYHGEAFFDTEERVLVRGSHLFPPATEDDIAAAEQRFGVALPPSYREFLKVSNGCLLGLGWTLLPVEKIGWLRDMNIYVINSDMMEYIEEGPDVIPDDVYYDYDDLGMIEEPFPFYRPQKLLHALCVSNPRDSVDQGMAIYPPFPGSPIQDDEWETFSSCGYRARSFKHMMEYKYLDVILGWRKDFERWEKTA